MQVPYVNLVAQHASLEGELLAAVRRVLRHGSFIFGPEVDELEECLSARLGVGHVVSVASGTDALVLALQLRGLGRGDEVLVPSHSFVASAHAVRLVGAEPVFVDVDPQRMLMDPKHLAGALTGRTRGVMAVHLGGHPCDMDVLVGFCEQEGLALIEDCAQAIGTRWRGKHVGSFGLGCFSLHPLKTLSALGDAGFVTSASEEQAEELRLMRNLGLVDRDHTAFVSGHSRMDTLQAALLLVKLNHLDEYLAQRRVHAAAYAGALASEYELISVPPEAEPSWSTFVVRHPERDRILKAARQRGFDIKIHYPVPIHRQAPYSNTCSRRLPETDRAVSSIMSLPVSPELSVPARDALIEVLLELAR